MKIIKPITVTDATLNTSNVPENDYTEWSNTTTYATGDYVIIAALHKVYKSQTDSNINKYPPDYLTDGDDKADPVVPNTWLEVSATNRWKMFDGKSRAATAQADTVEVDVAPGELFNSLALLNIEADSVSIVVEDPVEGVVYTHDADMIDLTEIIDFYEWFFLPLANNTDVVLTDLPSYINGVLTITALDTGGTVKIGELVIGTLKTLGVMRYGASIGIEDYSRKERDESGNAIIEERSYSKKVEYDVSIRSNRIYDIQRVLAQYRARPLVYIGVDGLSETVAYGFYKDFSIVLSGPVHSECSIQVEELS